MNYFSVPRHCIEPQSVQSQLCPTLCDSMDCSTPGFPVHHQLSELAQTHVHQVSDAIQTSHPLLSPSPPAFNLGIDLLYSVYSIYIPFTGTSEK